MKTQTKQYPLHSLRLLLSCSLLLTSSISSTAFAHDPIFGIGPHTLFKGGFEVATELHQTQRSDERETELGLEITYGLTSDWAVGIEIPYAKIRESSEASSGLSDISLFTKYRFWRKDTLGLQESAAVSFKLITDSASDADDPKLGTDTTDGILGLSYGYEGRKWYRWTSLRYRHNGTNNVDLQRGDAWKLDFAAGWRPNPSGYRESDTVWLLELNGEHIKHASLNGSRLRNTGGTEWFISPGIFWTTRNFAIKAGVQIPISHRLNGTQDNSDYRAQLVFEWHL